VSRLDCTITTLGCVMLELDDDSDNDDAREVQAIRWLYEQLRSEAANIRDTVSRFQGEDSCTADPLAVALEAARATRPTPNAPSGSPRVLEPA
jgi:hypothetical protein